MWADAGVKGKPSKWLMVFALLVLDHSENKEHSLWTL